MCLLAVVVAAAASAAPQKHSYILATATTGGTFYPVGVAIATLTKVKLEPQTGVSLSAISSAGSGENVKLLRDDQAQFAILQGLYGAWAWRGEGPLKTVGPQRHMRAITMLWRNVEHITLDERFARQGDLSDLKNAAGEKFSIGKRNSGTEGSGRHILQSIGVSPDEHFELSFMGYNASADAVQNGKIVGMNTPAGVPVGAVSRLFAVKGDTLKLLNVTDAQLAKINMQFPLWNRFVITANTYPGQNEAINTIAQPNFLAVRADVSDEDVYRITKLIYENLGFLKGIHKATNDMALNKAIDGLPMPLHSGAARFYREAGLTIPEELTPIASP